MQYRLPASPRDMTSKPDRDQKAVIGSSIRRAGGAAVSLEVGRCGGRIPRFDLQVKVRMLALPPRPRQSERGGRLDIREPHLTLKQS